MDTCVCVRVCGLTRLTSSTVMGWVWYRAPFCLRLSGGPPPCFSGSASLLKSAIFWLTLSLQLSSCWSAGSAWALWGSAALGELLGLGGRGGGTRRQR